ncbi:MAG TPA: MlaD family protein [Stellaceae bacterium]|nr:MlaD family protein [Stellaceae bacterium]
METRAPYVAVGTFVVLLIAGLVVAVLWFAQTQFREQRVYYDIYFVGSVTGLTNGSTVRENGVPAGRVAQIRLDPSDPSRVRVTVELRGGVPVKTDTVAALELQGLAGGVYIDLTGGTRDAPDLERKSGERYPVIASRRSGLEQVVTSAPELLQRLLSLSDQLSKVLSPENVQALSDILANFRAVSQGLASRSSELDAAIDNGAQAMQGLHDTLNSVNDILAGLKQLVLPQGGMQETLKSIDETSRRFGELAQHLDSLVSANGPQIGALTEQSLTDITQLVQQTSALEQQLSRIADEIERDPSRFLYGERREGYRPR